jgi:hypothetical protein
MVNVSLIEAILGEQDNPGHSTTRQIRDLYNIRSGEDPILQHSDEDKLFQTMLLKALEKLPAADDDDDDDDQPISYTVKLKDSDDSSTPTMKRRSIIKLPKEAKDQSESDETSSDSEKPSTSSSITITKPFSPLFLNNMKKFGVSTDWLAKRSNSLRQSSYSRSSVKSNTSKLDAMIKSASTKPIRSNRKLSFIESPTATRVETDKENSDPLVEEKKEEGEETTKPTPYDLSSEIDEDKDVDDSSPSKEFSLRIPRVNLPEEETQRLNSSSSSSSNEGSKQEKPKIKKKRRSKKLEHEQTTTDEPKKISPKKKDKNDQAQSRIEHFKKLLRISGIRFIIKNAELDQFASNKAKINYLKSLFQTAGFTGNLTIKECEKFRKKRDTAKELFDIQANAVDVKGSTN